MHTKDILAEALQEADLEWLAVKARQGIYHDFLSPLEDPAAELDRDLAKVGTPAALSLRRRHHLGEFDATKEESDAWAASPEGRETFGKLISDGKIKGPAR